MENKAEEREQSRPSTLEMEVEEAATDGLDATDPQWFINLLYCIMIFVLVYPRVHRGIAYAIGRRSRPELLNSHRCEQDSECVVMSIENCCGIYPIFIHKDATRDPFKYCEFDDCGLPSIDVCLCNLDLDGGRCQAEN